MATGAAGPFTFLLTDVEGSTRLWEDHPDRMGGALARHDAIVADEVGRAGGVLVRTKGEGDSAFAVFSAAPDAVLAAVSVQRRLRAERWGPTPIHVRMAIHTGAAEHRDDDYYGIEVNRCARLRAIAYGGQILLSGSATARVSDALPEATDVIDLGTHRLKDLSAPEHVFQIIHADLERDFPPLLSLDARPNNLPVELTSFVGRERELAEIRELVMSHRLVTLLGAGGTGKTRLALQVAGELIEELPEGAWFAQLAPVSDPDLVAQTVVNELRLPESPTRPALDTILAHLRDRSLLVVLDNCEQVADAACSIVGRVLEGCADVRVLTTSRERLGARGEAVYQVEPISTGDAAELFAQRARLVKPGFEITGENLATVDEICRRVDSLPLAIELAASRVRSLPPRDILARLTDTFRILRGTDRARIGRHESLGAAIDWSHALLDEQEQAVFRRLAVFVGGFGIAAAEAVCARGAVKSEDVLDLLARLVDKSMVVAGEGGDGTARYRLLETMREYAFDRLADTGETDATHEQHLAYYTSLGEEMNVRFDGPEQAFWLDRTQEEIDNFRAALAYSATANDDDAFIRLAGALGPFWYRRSVHEAHEWLDEPLSRADATRPWLRAAIWGTRFAIYSGDLDAAISRSDLALRLARGQGDPKWIVRALTEAAQVRMRTGEFELAAEHASEAVESARALGQPGTLWEALHRASTVELLHGSAAQARTLAEEALELARRAGADPIQLELTLYDAAWSAVATGELGTVPALVEEAFEKCLKHGDPYGLGMTLNTAGIAAAAEDDAVRALRLAGAGGRAWDRVDAVPAPEEQAMLDEWLGRARDQLTAEAADRAWLQGWSMPRDRAIAYALGDESAAGAEGAARTLTAREIEIAELVANRLTNREIADRLGLSERTVDAHVDHIRVKLGFRERSEIATWVAERSRA